VIGDAEFQAEVAADEEESVEGCVIAPSPRDARQDGADDDARAEEPLTPVAFPPEIEDQVSQDDEEQRGQAMKGRATPQSEQQRAGGGTTFHGPTVKKGDDQQTERHGRVGRDSPADDLIHALQRDD
jgi:hypothetical protein